MMAQNQLFVAPPPLKTGQHKTLEQLLNHNSDTQVKPIIGNKDIEIIPPLPALTPGSL